MASMRWTRGWADFPDQSKWKVSAEAAPFQSLERPNNISSALPFLSWSAPWHRDTSSKKKSFLWAPVILGISGLLRSQSWDLPAIHGTAATLLLPIDVTLVPLGIWGQWRTSMESRRHPETILSPVQVMWALGKTHNALSGFDFLL